MVTRRTSHAGHARPSLAQNKRLNRRDAGLGSTRPGRGGTSAAHAGGRGARHAQGPTVRRSAASRSSINNVRPSVSGGGAAGGSDGALITRRRLLFGAIGLGVLAAAGGGAALVSSMQDNADDEIDVLTVAEDAVTANTSLETVDDYATCMSLVGSYELPYGTLIWANDDSVAACLLPTETAKPLTQVGLLSLSTGTCTTVLENAVGQAEGFEIYDVRATSSGLIWTEADILDGVWRIYTARVADGGGSIGSPALVDEGSTGEWDTPTIAAVGGNAFWQVLPALDGPRSTEESQLKRAAMGTGAAEVVYTSNGRMATAPYASEDAVVITPRCPASRTNYQLTCIDAATGETRDTMVLPSSMAPLEAGYGETGFTFAFDAIYSYGGGIANLGTYTPMQTASGSGYSDVPWFRYARTPTTAPAWCGRYFMVKSSTAVVGVDFSAGQSFAFDVENGADDYGEFLASSGSRDTVVTYTNIDYTPISGDAVNCCRVRIWTPVA